MIDSNFNCDPRRQQELRLRPYANDLYYQHIKCMSIDRFDDHMNPHPLDQHHGIDVVLTLPNGAIMTGQEKFLSHKYARYSSLTVEYYQNQWTEEKGDWFKLAPQFYFCGYENATSNGFCKYVIVNWVSLTLDTSIENEWRHNANKNGHARASFVYIPFSRIPNEHIITAQF